MTMFSSSRLMRTIILFCRTLFLRFMMSPNMFVVLCDPQHKIRAIQAGYHHRIGRDCPMCWNAGGVSRMSRTGRWKYVKTVEDSSGGISEIHFINLNHWDVLPMITDVILKHYPTTDSVRDAQWMVLWTLS